MDNIISVKNLTKTYKTYKRKSGFKASVKSFFKRETVIINAVKDVSFNINEGDITGILGPNGAGKSTIIKMLAGTLYQTSGEIDIMGFSPARDRLKYVTNIGAVFGQKSQLIWDIPPIDSFLMNKAIYGISDSDYNERLKLLSELFEVTEIMHKPTRVLSLGERMKCEFIMAMLHKPKIVFLDEPTIGLDVIAKQKIREFVKEMNNRGTTFILTTHDLEDVEQLAQKVIIINHGEKVFDDSITKLRLNLGAKKLISLTLAKPAPSFSIKGVKVVSNKSPLELELEADIDETSLSDFIKELSQHFEFTDISIKQLPMETIITNIYTH